MLQHDVATRRISPSDDRTSMRGLCFASSQAPSLYPASRIESSYINQSHGLRSVSPVSALLRRIPARLPLLGQLINYLATRLVRDDFAMARRVEQQHLTI